MSSKAKSISRDSPFKVTNASPTILNGLEAVGIGLGKQHDFLIILGF